MNRWHRTVTRTTVPRSGDGDLRGFGMWVQLAGRAGNFVVRRPLCW